MRIALNIVVAVCTLGAGFIVFMAYAFAGTGTAKTDYIFLAGLAAAMICIFALGSYAAKKATKPYSSTGWQLFLCLLIAIPLSIFLPFVYGFLFLR